MDDEAQRKDAGRRAPLDGEHWSRQRAHLHRETIEHLRERSRAPGVAEGGAERNHYCMACNGVIPLRYVRTEPAAKELERCPHCGAELDRNVRAMFNWVETDQVHGSDARAVLLPALCVVVVIVAFLCAWLILT